MCYFSSFMVKLSKRPLSSIMTVSQSYRRRLSCCPRVIFLVDVVEAVKIVPGFHCFYSLRPRTRLTGCPRVVFPLPRCRGCVKRLRLLFLVSPGHKVNQTSMLYSPSSWCCLKRIGVPLILYRLFFFYLFSYILVKFGVFYVFFLLRYIIFLKGGFQG